MRAKTLIGSPCKHGHAGIRYRRGGHCRECTLIQSRNRSVEIRKRNVARERQRRHNDPQYAAKMRTAARIRQRKHNGLPQQTREAPKDCELCGRHPKGQVLDLDHCHVSGEFRGWLCRQCNHGLGLLGDHIPTIIERLTRYARRST